MYFVPEGQHDRSQALRAWPGVWTFGPRPKVLARNLVDTAEVHAGKPQLDLSKASAVEWLLSRRDRLIVARHEVPGKRQPKEPSRRVRYDRAQLIPHPT